MAASFSDQSANVRLRVLSVPASSSEQRPDARLESQPKRASFREYRFPSEGLESQSIPISLPENRSRTVRLQNPTVLVNRRPAVESVEMSKDVDSLTATDDPSRTVSASVLSANAAKVNALW